MKITYILIAIPLIVVIAIAGYMFYGMIKMSGSPDFKVVNYYLPEDFSGCAIIVYDQTGAPPLTINEDKELHIHFDEHGFFKTSSPQNFGWKDEDFSGFHQANYYVGDTLLEPEAIHGHNTGSYGGEQAEDVHYESFSVNIVDACQSEKIIDIIEQSLHQ